MEKNCSACNAELSGHTRFRDVAGNYYCRTCMEKTRTAKCEICGRDTSGQRSFFRTDGTLYCESCFQAAANPEPEGPERNMPAQQDSRVQEAEPASTDAGGQPAVPALVPVPENNPPAAAMPESADKTVATPEPVTDNPDPAARVNFREISTITDIPEPGFGWGILTLAIVVGVLVGIFSGQLVLMPLAAGVVCLVHWLLMYASE